MNKNRATFALATIGIVIGCLSTSTISQSQSPTDPRSPSGYWLLAPVCIDLDTGDVVSASPPAPSRVTSKPGCAPGYWRLDRLCLSPSTGDVELVDDEVACTPARERELRGCIVFGGALSTLVLTNNVTALASASLTAGLAFSLGLVALVLAGGELFAGNNLMALTYACRKVSARALFRNWTLACAANAVGSYSWPSPFTTALPWRTAVPAGRPWIAEAKARLGVVPAFLRGALCNALVCLAIWLSVAARSLEGKVIAIIFPISAFVGLDFEHFIANFYLIPVALLAGANVSIVDLAANIVPVTAGNTVGGAGVALAYWLVQVSGKRSREAGLSRSRFRAGLSRRSAHATISGLTQGPPLTHNVAGVPGARRAQPRSSVSARR